MSVQARASTHGRSATGSQELYPAALVGAAEMLASGPTTVLDHFGVGPHTDADGLDAALAAYRDIGIRAAVAPMLEDRDIVRAAADEELHERAEHRRSSAGEDRRRRELVDAYRGFYDERGQSLRPLER